MSSEQTEETEQGVHTAMVAVLPRLRRFCMMLTASRDVGEDLAQATVTRALERVAQWQTGTRLDSWMFRIAQNMHLDSVRSLRGRSLSVDLSEIADLAGSDGLHTLEQRSDLRRAQEAIAR